MPPMCCWCSARWSASCRAAATESTPAPPWPPPHASTVLLHPAASVESTVVGCSHPGSPATGFRVAPLSGNALLWLSIVALVTLTACTSSSRPQRVEPSQPHLRALAPRECQALLADDASSESLRQALARSTDALEHLKADRQLPVL